MLLPIPAVLTVTCFLSWLSSCNLIFDNPVPWLWIDVQFEEGFLKVTMTNNDDCDYILREVFLSNRASTILAGELVNEQILRGERTSICLGFNWTSGYEYGIHVRTTDDESIAVYTWAP